MFCEIAEWTLVKAQKHFVVKACTCVLGRRHGRRRLRVRLRVRVWSVRASARVIVRVPPPPSRLGHAIGIISALTSFTCFRDFLIIGCGFSSSSENARVRGSKSRPDDAIENAETRAHL